MTRVGSRLILSRRTRLWAASYSDVQPRQLEPPFPPAPAVRAPHRAQRRDQVGRTAALRGPQSPEGLAGLARVASAGSDPASGAKSRPHPRRLGEGFAGYGAPVKIGREAALAVVFSLQPPHGWWRCAAQVVKTRR